MIRGTTAQFKFKLPYAKDELVWTTIKFWQPNNPSKLLPIIKELEDCSASDDPKNLCVSLTAEETSRFLDKYKAKVQFRAQHLQSGAVFGIRPKSITVYPMDIEDSIVPIENADNIVILDGETIIDE